MSKEKNPKTRRVEAFKQGKARKDVPSGRSWFLGVGINQYQTFPQLHNAVKDVEDVLALLLKQYDVEEDCVVLLQDAFATREVILDELDALDQIVEEDDKLIIYYSGHGHLDHRGLGYWIPYDAKKGKTSNYIRNSTIRDYVKVIKARHTLLISDSCFSGSLFVRGGVRSDVAMEELERRVSRWAICSGRHDEEVNDGEPGKNSPFAESILDILRGNSKRKLNVAKLADRVVELTRANYRQLPEGNPLYGVGHKGGQYVFCMKTNEAADWEDCQRHGGASNYEAFLRKYPEGEYVETARQQLAIAEEEEAWQLAQQQHTVYGYYRYKHQYPSGRFVFQSLSAIKELEEEQHWGKAKKRDLLSGYEEYLTEYPQGKYRDEAGNRIRALVAKEEESHLWLQCLRRQSNEDYEAYLVQFPQGRYTEEARARLSVLMQAKEAEERAWQETHDWEGAQNQYSIEAYREFLAEYPSGKFAEEAKAGLELILRKKLEEDAQWREQEVWERVCQNRTLSEVNAYLTMFPRGKHRKEIWKWKKELLREKQRVKRKKLKRYSGWGTGFALFLFLLLWSIKTLGDGGTEKRDEVKLELLEIEYGELEDKRDGQFYKTILIDKKEWMAENLNYETSDGKSWCYEKDNDDCQKYGRLYTFDSAMKACPTGWQLPSSEDWQELIYLVTEDTIREVVRKEAFRTLVTNATVSFNALFGGWCDPRGRSYDQTEFGYYWSFKMIDEPTAWGFVFNSVKEELNSSKFPKKFAFSCRCVRSESSTEEERKPSIAIDGTERNGKQVKTPIRNTLETDDAKRETNTELRYMTDIRDGKSYKTVILNGQEWMAENLLYEPMDGESWCYDGNESNCKEYGRLYTYETALRACPPGWRLPTDKDWLSLDQLFAGTNDELESKGLEALEEGKKSGFNVRLGGQRFTDGSFDSIGKFGSYWSSKAANADMALGYSFYSGRVGLSRVNRSNGRSCRCIKE